MGVVLAAFSILVHPLPVCVRTTPVPPGPLRFRDLHDDDRSVWIPYAITALSVYPSQPGVVEACLYTLNLLFSSFPSEAGESDAASAIASGGYDAFVAALDTLPHSSAQVLEVLRFLCIIGQSGTSTSSCSVIIIVIAVVGTSHADRDAGGCSCGRSRDRDRHGDSDGDGRDGDDEERMVLVCRGDVCISFALLARHCAPSLPGRCRSSSDHSSHVVLGDVPRLVFPGVGWRAGSGTGALCS